MAKYKVSFSHRHPSGGTSGDYREVEASSVGEAMVKGLENVSDSPELPLVDILVQKLDEPKEP